MKPKLFFALELLLLVELTIGSYIPWVTHTIGGSMREVQVVGGSNINAETINTNPLFKNMDHTAVRDLLTSKQPITKSSTDNQGRTVKTTYSLLANGDIKMEKEISGGDLNTDWEWGSPTFESRFKPSANDNIFGSHQKPFESDFWSNSNDFSASNNGHGAVSNQPLPSLDEFLKNQYGTSSSLNSEKPVTTIQLDNIPATGILKDGEQISSDIFTNAPSLNQVYSSPSENSSTITKVRKITKTFSSPNLPTSADLPTNILDVLQRAGINPDNIKSIDDNVITSTRTQPDGAIITTTYKVDKIPSSNSDAIDYSTNFNNRKTFSFEKPNNMFSAPPILSTTPLPYVRTRFHTIVEPPSHPITTSLVSNNNSIDGFLSKLNLSARDIQAENGEIVKTFVEDDGRILSVKLTLSNIKGDDGGALKPMESLNSKPIK